MLTCLDNFKINAHFNTIIESLEDLIPICPWYSALPIRSVADLRYVHMVERTAKC